MLKNPLFYVVREAKMVLLLQNKKTMGMKCYFYISKRLFWPRGQHTIFK